jgi:hypothetical protein
MASGWAYVGCADFATGSGPTGSVQFRAEPGFQITGSHSLVFYTSSVASPWPGAPNFAKNTLVLSGTLYVSGTISASHLHIRDITEIDATGSTKFGDSADDKHVRTGSMYVYASRTDLEIPSLIVTASSDGTLTRTGIGLPAPSGALHVQVGAGAAIAPSTWADDFVLSSDVAPGVSLLSPDNQNPRIYFGSPSDAVHSQWLGGYDLGYTLFGTSVAGHELHLESGNATTALLLDANQNVTASAGDLLVTNGSITASADITAHAFYSTHAEFSGSDQQEILKVYSKSKPYILFITSSGKAEDEVSITMGGGPPLNGGFGNNAALTVSGSISASVNVSASQFWGDGTNITNVGLVSAITNGVDNRVTTFASADALNGEANLTFDGSLLTVAGNVAASVNVSASSFYSTEAQVSGTDQQQLLKVYSKAKPYILFVTSSGAGADEASITMGGGPPQADTDGTNNLLTVSGSISASVNVSASQFWGDGTNITNVGVISSISNGADNRVTTFSSADALNGEASLTFDGDLLTVVGDYGITSSAPVSASAFYSTEAQFSGSDQQQLLKVYSKSKPYILFVTSSGAGVDEASITMGGGAPQADVDGTNNLLTVSGSISASVNVSASQFWGNGANLTGLSAFPFTGEAAITGSLHITGSDSGPLLEIFSDTVSDVLTVSATQFSASVPVTASAYRGHSLAIGTDTVLGGTLSTVAGGTRNEATDDYAVVAGGYDNTATATYTFVGGGVQNNATATQASVVGGNGNDVTQQQSFIGGGASNTVAAAASAIVGGSGNRVEAGDAFIGAGNTNYNTGQFGALCAGYNNVVGGSYSFVGAGKECTASAAYTVVGGGYRNKATGLYSSILGGTYHTASGQRAAIIGGTGSTVSANGSIAIGSGLSVSTANTITLGGGTSDGGNHAYSIVVSGTLSASSNVTASGHVSASTYYGDGSNLTGIAGGGGGGGIFTATAVNTAYTTSSVGIGQGLTTPAALLHASASVDALTASLLQVDSKDLGTLLYVTASGRVGIGTSTPGSLVEISGIDNDMNEGFVLFNRGAANSDSTGIYLKHYDDRSETFIRDRLFGNWGTELQFGTSLKANESAVRMTLDSSGSLGIGCAVGVQDANRALLHVSSSNDAITGSLLQIDSKDFGPVLFVTGSGRVGIGTATPDHELAVNGNISASLNISASQFWGDGSNLTGIAGGGGGGIFTEINGTQAATTSSVSIGSSGTPAATLHVSSSGDAALFRVDGLTETAPPLFVTGSGRVGIGTQAPGATLDVLGDTLSDQLRLGHGGAFWYKMGRGSDGFLDFQGTQTSHTGYTFKNSSGTGVVRIEAENSRLAVTGSVLPGADNTHDLGSAGKRWANVYTGDLHLANDRGDWTVVEEEDYLTIKNNKTGKRFKLLMEEIE